MCSTGVEKASEFFLLASGAFSLPPTSLLNKFYVWGEIGERAWIQIHCLFSEFTLGTKFENLGSIFFKSPSLPANPQLRNVCVCFSILD